MEARRVNMFERFTQKTVENQKYLHWFPLKENLKRYKKPPTHAPIEKVGQTPIDCTGAQCMQFIDSSTKKRNLGPERPLLDVQQAEKIQPLPDKEMKNCEGDTT